MIQSTNELFKRSTINIVNVHSCSYARVCRGSSKRKQEVKEEPKPPALSMNAVTQNASTVVSCLVILCCIFFGKHAKVLPRGDRNGETESQAQVFPFVVPVLYGCMSLSRNLCVLHMQISLMWLSLCHWENTIIGEPCDVLFDFLIKTLSMK